MLRFSGVGVTDVGRVRENNEDSAFLGPYLALVADGVGGAAAGEVASATATHIVATQIMGRRHNLSRALGKAVEAARDRIVTGVEVDQRRAGMATTLTAIVTNGHEVVMAHIGDSRAYRLSGREMTRVSTDHTYVQQLIDHEQLDDEAARRHPWRNVVLRSLSAAPVEPRDLDGGEADIVALQVQQGDRLLVCSDGLSDLVPESRIAELLAAGSPRDAASRLRDAALHAGGTDNITCLVLDVIDGPPVIGGGEFLGAVRDPANIVTPSVRTGTLPA